MKEIKRAIYQVKNESDEIVYIGSTTKWTVEGLEQNHRLWESKGYNWSAFRGALTSSGKDWKFSWAIEPSVCTQEFIEICETALIQYLKPRYNVDTNPYLSSVKHGRYDKVV